jgi:glycosyltransferase involved in cell wall biosynthesis
MRFLFIVGREISYQRNDVLLRAFQRLGEVDIVATDSKPKSLILTSLALGFRSLKPLLLNKYDVVFVGFYGHLLMLPVGIIARWRKIPILFDAFVSNYDTLVNDRQLIPGGSIFAQLALWLDRQTCHLADYMLLDTPQHVDYFCHTFSLSPECVGSIPVGCNEEIFFSHQQTRQKNGKTRVLFYCTYQPLHGAHIVIEAANALKEKNIFFHLIGSGQEYARVNALVDNYQLTKVKFTPFVNLETLRDEINRADICLGGHFGTSEKADRVVPGKIYQIMAVGRPLIAAETRANLSILVNGESGILIPPNDPVALAEAIRNLCNDSALREKIAKGGQQVYRGCCSESIITSKLEAILHKITRVER